MGELVQHSGIQPGVLKTRDGLLVVEVEGVVGADHELRGAKGVYQVTQRRRVKHQGVVLEFARLLGG